MSDQNIVGYAVAKICRWDDLTVQSPYMMRDTPVVAPDGQIGYMPVYATLEALQAEWGYDCDYVILRMVERER